MKMGFNKNNITHIEQTPIVEENFTNAICYGKTGSGKTSGFILPNIEERIKLGHGLLIYDFKGSLHEQVKVIANKYSKLDDVVEIGKLWGAKINIIKNLNSRILRESFLNLRGTSQEDSNISWAYAGANLFTAIHTIQINLEQCLHLNQKFENKHNNDLISHKSYVQETSLGSIFNTIKSVENLQNFFQDTRNNITKIEKNIIDNLNNIKAKKIIMKMAHHLKIIDKTLLSIKTYEKLKSDDADVSGLYAVLDVVVNAISSIAINESFNKNEFDVVSHLRAGKIVILTLANIDESMLGLINLSIYSTLQKNLDKKNNKAVSIFIDEAQKVLTSNHLPDVDVCREHRFEYIFATQDKLLLDTVIGEKNREILLRNIIDQYSFSTIDDGNLLKQFEYKNLLTSQKRFAKPIFFTFEELFDTEYKYQFNLKVFENYVNIEEVANKTKYLAMDSPEIYQQGKVYIKDKQENLKIVELSFTDESVLDKYKNINTDDYLDLITQENMQNENKELGKVIQQLKIADTFLNKKLELLNKKFEKFEHRYSF